MIQLLKKVIRFFGLYPAARYLLRLFRPERYRLKDERFYNHLLDCHLNNTYGDQKGQLKFLINIFFNYEKNGLKKNGFFVDLAAADGITGSNTYFLEKYLDWKGILFEPNSEYGKSIKSIRTSPLVSKCVTDNAGDVVSFRIDNGQLGGIVGDRYDNNSAVRGKQLKSAEIIEIPTTTLEKE